MAALQQQQEHIFSYFVVENNAIIPGEKKIVLSAKKNCTEQDLQQRFIDKFKEPLKDVCNVCLKRPADAEGQRLIWCSFNTPKKFNHKMYFATVCLPQGPCHDTTELFMNGQFDVNQESKHGIYPCAGCDQFIKSQPGKADDEVLSCPSCLQVKYCSEVCQQAHFPKHQTRCIQIA